MRAPARHDIVRETRCEHGDQHREHGQRVAGLVYVDRGTLFAMPLDLERFPAWSRSAPELVYETLDHRLMAASYRIVDSAFVPEPSREWSPAQLADSGVVASFDLAPDGERALVLLSPESRAGRDHVTLLLDFDAEVRRAMRR